MVKFKRDISNPETIDLVVKKNMERRDIQMRCRYMQILAALLGLFAVYEWLCMHNASILYPLLAFLCLTLILCAKKLLSTTVRNKIMLMSAHDPMMSEYTVDEDGVHVHTEYTDTQMHWTHFVGWGTQGGILYLETNDSKVIVCHQNQVSQEDFAQLKALAAAHIPAQK